MNEKENLGNSLMDDFSVPIKSRCNIFCDVKKLLINRLLRLQFFLFFPMLP